MNIVKTLLACVLGGVLSVSCSRQEVEGFEPLPKSYQAKGTLMSPQVQMLEEKLAIVEHPQRSKSEAEAIAMSLIQGKRELKNLDASSLHIECILTPKSILRNISSGVQPVDTAMYLVNFGKSEGFAIISGDKRTEELLAVSSDGFLKRGQETYGNGLDVFLSRLPSFYESSLGKFEQDLEELEKSSDIQTYRRRRRSRSRTSNTIIEYSDWVDVSKSPILLRTNWGQRAPYNNHAVVIDGKRTPAGCTATAFAQLLAYHQFPKKWNNINISWEDLTKKTYVPNDSPEANDIATVFRALGDRLENSWGLDGTGADDGKIPDILREMGYSTPSSRTDFDLNQAISSISQNKPIILSGYRETYTYETGWWIFSKTHTGYRNGHAWVGDGILNQERTVTVKSKSTGDVISTRKETRTLIHCNWGWDGYRNGYFLANVFDSENPEKSDSFEYPSDGKRAYQYNVKNILYVTP